MDNIKISLAEVSNSASQIRLINTNLDDTLNYIKQMMNQLNAVWNSDDATAITNRFMQFSRRFEEESLTIEEYARFLDLTVSSYDNLESTIQNNASSF